ncbi:hypothetical protein Pmani_021519 [Petrolisthes manimaculis]|uniref:Uncharacterized protein n=1 Tax=Petrolisthes manimaculis TaxID=1843537 RepID=A0AAE1PGB6_9EUCA|nr:hypothetical protein Pmani_021519 [Petrolisthes manimaculis]
MLHGLIKAPDFVDIVVQTACDPTRLIRQQQDPSLPSEGDNNTLLLTPRPDPTLLLPACLSASFTLDVERTNDCVYLS